MAQTVIPAGHPMARKVYGAAVFAELTRKPTFSNAITAPAPKQAEAQRKLAKEQSAHTYPCVRVSDLSKGGGDSITVDLFNILQGKPTMGDRKLVGRMMPLKNSTMEVTLDQVRGGVDTGGRMSQQRTVHNLRGIGRAGITGWWARFMDQWKLVHICGARGDMDTADWVIPTSDDPEFAEIMVNTVQAPTYNRHFYAGDATGLDDLDTADILSLDDIDKLRAAIDESDMPLQPVVLEDDPGSWDEPLYVLYVSSRQWHYLQNRTGASSWRQFMANARERGSKNPLFKGEPGMWNGILVRKTQRAVRFHQGTTVTVATSASAFTTTTVQIAADQFDGDGSTAAGVHAVDRAFLLGAQALAEVWGKDSESGTHMRWWEEQIDHGNAWEASVAGIGGCAKLRFRDSNEVDTDHGVMVIDSYAPDPRRIKVS